MLRRVQLKSETRISARDDQYIRRPCKTEQELNGNDSGMLAEYFGLLAEERKLAGQRNDNDNDII
jgi:hypothetical protein